MDSRRRLGGDVDQVQERDPQPRPQLPGGPGGAGAGVIDEDDLGRRVAAELVVDRLDRILVADPGGGVDARLGERGEGQDEAALGLALAPLGVGGPALHEARAVRSEDEDLGRGRRAVSPALGHGDEAVDRDGALERLVRHNEQMRAAVVGRRRLDRQARGQADRHHDQQAGGQRAHRHREPGAAEVGAGDHRERDRGDHQRHLPGREDVSLIAVFAGFACLAHARSRLARPPSLVAGEGRR
ncbi:MAG: hypothetical protein EDQ89_06865 [Acidobacteria bacterium]|nr:MAG: hypothetical protein EDQ89_06865 [Acidobacteriota bacterium]